MSIPNYLYALANHKGPATVVAGGMIIPVKLMDIEHESAFFGSAKTTFKCLVVNDDEIKASETTPTKILNQCIFVPDGVNRTMTRYSANPIGNMMDIERVIFNDPATIVIWADGTKTVVKCQEGDVYSKETGLALCIAKKALGNKGSFNDVFHKWIPEEEEESVHMSGTAVDFPDNHAFTEALARLNEAATKAGRAIRGAIE